MFPSSCPTRFSIIRLVCVALLAAVYCVPSWAQEPKVMAPHKPVDLKDPVSKTRRLPAMSRTLIGGFWMTDANRKASIYLKNALETSEITVRPILFLSNGNRYDLPVVTLAPKGTSVISINTALENLGIAPWGTLSGYVELGYLWAWDPLCATVTSLDAVHSTIFTTGFQPADVTNLPVRARKVVEGLNTVEGLWWKPAKNVAGFVALSNASGQPAEAKLKISNEKNIPLGEQNVHLSPHGTKVIQMTELQALAAGAAGGLQVQYSGPPDAMLINGGLEDDESGFSANLPFHVLAMPEASKPARESYAELGLMTGPADPMLSFPGGTVFAPFSVPRNVGEEPVTVTPSFYWMEGGAAHSFRLARFTMAPLASLSLDVPRLLETAGLGNFHGSVNLILDAEGLSRSLLLASGSVDAKNTYVFQVLPRGIQESAAKSISYWSTGNGDDTMVTIWNPADEAQDFIFTLSFDGGHYRMPVHLEDRATHTFNISEIIHSQLPDDEGNVIPIGIHEGSAKISGTQADNEQILVAMDAGTYNVRKATCSYYCINCDGTVSAYVDYGSISPFAVGVTSQFYLHETWNTGLSTSTSSGSWSSNHTNIATVGSTNGSGRAVAPGSVLFSASTTGPVYNSYYCQYDPFCPYNSNVAGSGNQEVAAATVSFSPISYVVVGQTATTTATVTPSSNTAAISLSISSPAAKVSPTGTFTTTTNVVVKGLTVGTATLTATVRNPDGTNPYAGSLSFAVTSAAPTAAITQRTSGTVSSDNAALGAYQGAEGTTSLGPIIGSGTLKGCFVGLENVGTITPNNYTGNVIVHQWIIQDATYTNSTSTGGVANADDTAQTAGRDDNPQSGTSAGKVYAVDAPGANPPNVDGKTYRYRGNFYAFAALPDGTKISSNYNFYVRASCTKTSSGYQFFNDISGDNQIGAGTTALTWNLQ